MIYKHLNKIFIFIILSILVNGEQYIPAPRIGHTAVYLGDKIYFIGGLSESIFDATYGTSSFFYLSLGKIFLDSRWGDLRGKGVNFPYTNLHTTSIGGAGQDSIFIIGGRPIKQIRDQTKTQTQAQITNLQVYKFDTKTNTITQIQGITPPNSKGKTDKITQIQGTIPPNRYGMNSVSYEGKIYLFGGINDSSNNTSVGGINNSGNNTSVTYFDILDTVNMNWQNGSLVNAPPLMVYYTATLVNGVIYYIGGLQQTPKTSTGFDYIEMSSIYQYDIVGDMWSLKPTNGIKLEGRRYHSAVLVDNKICIYGGVRGGANDIFSNVTELIATLDTTTLTWSIPSLIPPFNDTNKPNLHYHTATLFNKSMMLLAFGYCVNSYGSEYFNFDDIYTFNFGDSTVSWNKYKVQDLVDYYQPTTSAVSLAGETSSSKAAVAGILVGSVAIFLTGIAVFSLIYRNRNRNKVNYSVKREFDHSGVPGVFNNQISTDDKKTY